MEPGSKKIWFTTKEVCARLDLDPRQLREYVDAGIFPRGIRRGKQRLAWSAEDIEAMIWIEKNRHRLRPSKEFLGAIKAPKTE